MKKMKNAGFSLVELIVVIAIMAILVGVAVPVYTSYVEKSQKAKDVQMTEEIAHAMEIAAIADGWANTYSITQDGTYIGAVILHPDKVSAELEGATASDAAIQEVYDALYTELEDALVTTFGEDYAEKLTLSYDGWEGTLSGDNLSLITSSSYAGKTEKLMNDVQLLTNALKGFVGTRVEDGEVSALFGPNGADFEQWLVDTGVVTKNDSGNMLVDTQSVANAATLFVADQTTNISEEDFVEYWTTHAQGYDEVQDLYYDEGHGFGVLVGYGASDGNELTLMPAVAAEYARFEAFVNYLGCAEASALFTSGTENLGYLNGDKNTVATASGQVIQNLETAMMSVLQHAQTCPNCRPNAITDYFGEGGQAEKDAKAYYAMLGQVNNSSDKVMSDLSSESLYSEGELLAYVNSYMTAAELLSELGATDGQVVIVFSLASNGSLIANTYPIDYTE